MLNDILKEVFSLKTPVAAVGIFASSMIVPMAMNALPLRNAKGESTVPPWVIIAVSSLLSAGVVIATLSVGKETKVVKG
jgi:hypothetical protein